MGILTHSSSYIIEHEVLIVVMDKTVVQRQHLYFLRQLRYQCHVGRHQRNRLHDRRFIGLVTLFALQQ